MPRRKSVRPPRRRSIRLASGRHSRYGARQFVPGGAANRYSEEDETEIKTDIRYILSAINWVTREATGNESILNSQKAARKAFTPAEKKGWGKRINAYGRLMKAWKKDSMNVKDLHDKMREDLAAWKKKKGSDRYKKNALGKHNFFIWDLMEAVMTEGDDGGATFQFVAAQWVDKDFAGKVVDKMFEAKVDDANVSAIVEGLIAMSNRMGGENLVLRAVEIMAFALANWLGYGYYLHHLPDYRILQLGGDTYKSGKVYRFPILNEIIGIRPLDGELETLRKQVQNWPYSQRWKVVFPSDFDGGNTYYISKNKDHRLPHKLRGNDLTAKVLLSEGAIIFRAVTGAGGEELTARIGVENDPDTGTTIIDEDVPIIVTLGPKGEFQGGEERQMYSSADTAVYSARNDRAAMASVLMRKF